MLMIEAAPKPMTCIMLDIEIYAPVQILLENRNEAAIIIAYPHPVFSRRMLMLKLPFQEPVTGEVGMFIGVGPKGNMRFHSSELKKFGVGDDTPFDEIVDKVTLTPEAVEESMAAVRAMARAHEAADIDDDDCDCPWCKEGPLSMQPRRDFRADPPTQKEKLDMMAELLARAPGRHRNPKYAETQ